MASKFYQFLHGLLYQLMRYAHATLTVSSCQLKRYAHATRTAKYI
ncbi:hypothetical protein [Moorena sp. SIO4A1]|nr:hypothetical protein [Moorena sp. SIO4A1]